MPDNPYSSPIESEPGKVFPGITNTAKHSAFGIASFACSVACLLIFVAGTVAAEAFSIPVDQSAAMASIVLAAVGIGLGVASLFRKDRRRVYGFLGLMFSSAMLFVLLMLIILELLY